MGRGGILSCCFALLRAILCVLVSSLCVSYRLPIFAQMDLYLTPAPYLHPKP
jgi:hypothetical protein